MFGQRIVFVLAAKKDNKNEETTNTVAVGNTVRGCVQSVSECRDESSSRSQTGSASATRSFIATAGIEPNERRLPWNALMRLNVQLFKLPS
jgi:hypothetical protein